jgi:D-alanyl-D-alanine carboxypeptidase (penicillin-binding protein 5/6)
VILTGARRRAGTIVVALAASLAVTLGTGAPCAPAAEPRVSAPAAILVEPATGDVVFWRRARDQRAVASATKLMTALVTLERRRLGDELTAVPYRALAIESVIGLRGGERLTVADLLRGLLLASANDAAATLAARVGGSRRRFVALMNRRARRLGLRATRFANPVGLDDPDNHSSAEDLVKLTLILRRHAFFRRVTDLPRATLRSGDRSRTVLNRNLLVRRVAEVNGVKTGHTLRAGYVLVGSATRAGVTVVSAVLGARSESARDADTLALLRHGLRRYARVEPVRRGRRFASARLRFRDERMRLVAARGAMRTARRDERIVTRVVGAPAELDGPLPAGARVGTIEVRWRGRVVDRVALVTARAVPEASLLQRVDGVIGRALLVLVGAAVALASLQMALVRRRRARRRARRRPGGTEIA